MKRTLSRPIQPTSQMPITHTNSEHVAPTHTSALLPPSEQTPGVWQDTQKDIASGSEKNPAPDDTAVYMITATSTDVDMAEGGSLHGSGP